MNTPVANPTLDVSGTAPIPFGRLVQVEIRKSYDTRAGFWLLVSIGIVVGLLLGIATIITVVQDDPVALGDFIAIAAYPTGFLLLPVLGIMLVTSEWTQRTAMVTFSLEPRRSKTILAKLLVGVLLTLATVAVSIAAGVVCTLICQATVSDVSWTFGWNNLFGFVATQSLSMMGGFALAALLLNTPAAIVLYVVYRWVLPIAFGIASYNLDWFDSASQWFDFQRAQEPLFDMSISTGSEWAHLVVSGLIWLVLPLALGMTRILRAEVK